MTHIPNWLADLEDEDLSFVKKFILASGSLKEIAGLYGVSYPTVRLRLDRLIQKIKLTERAVTLPAPSLRVSRSLSKAEITVPMAMVKVTMPA